MPTVPDRLETFTKSLSSTPSPPPLEMIKTGKEHTKVEPSQLQIVPSSPDAESTPFELPDGWIMEVRPRGFNSAIKDDKYYYEPETGKRFRSLLSIRRHLNGEEKVPCLRAPKDNRLSGPVQVDTLRRVVYGGKMWTMDELDLAREKTFEGMVPTTAQHRVSSVLPDGWIVEEIPRRCGMRSDRYYIEPDTGIKFRSVPEVQKFLAGEERKARRCKSLKLTNHSTLKKRSPKLRSDKSKRDIARNIALEIIQAAGVDITNPPDKINWVLNDPGEDSWSPFVNETRVPDHVKELWSETFLVGMTAEGKKKDPRLTMGE